MNRYSLTLLLVVFLFASCRNSSVQVVDLTNENFSTVYTGTEGVNHLLFITNPENSIKSYTVYSSEESSLYDPASWILKGSMDGKKWDVLDERKDQTFCSRFQEITYSLHTPSNYIQYILEMSTASQDTLKLGNVIFNTTDPVSKWEGFNYPEVEFIMEDPDNMGSMLFRKFVQDPNEYIKYHSRKVAEILFYSAQDTMPDVQKIRYILKDYDGLSAKSGNPPVITVVYSTQYIEKIGVNSFYDFNYETRGVLYHELVHAYQFEPKGIGTYGTNKEFWACIEGMADAVRAEAGYFDIQSLRKPGGHWLDGYKTTGFFLQWLTGKEPDAIRKFHETVRDIDVWSFDKAIKQVFGEETGIDSMWDEYQNYLLQL